MSFPTVSFTFEFIEMMDRICDMMAIDCLSIDLLFHNVSFPTYIRMIDDWFHGFYFLGLALHVLSVSSMFRHDICHMHRDILL